jgi:hypothetical protein
MRSGRQISILLPPLSPSAPLTGRKKVLNRRLTKEELKEEDFAAYLASDEGEEGEGGGVCGGWAVAVHQCGCQCCRCRPQCIG